MFLRLKQLYGGESLSGLLWASTAIAIYLNSKDYTTRTIRDDAARCKIK